MTSRKPEQRHATRWSNGEAGVRERLATALREWCSAQGIAIDRAHTTLAKGWPKSAITTARRAKANDSGRDPEPVSRAVVQAWAGSAAPRVTPRAETLPNGRTLWALCERLGINAEWLFTGTGPRERSALAAGAVLDQAALCRELEGHVRGALGPDTRKRLRALVLTVNGEAVFTSAVARVNMAAQQIIARDEAVRSIEDPLLREHTSRSLRAVVPNSQLLRTDAVRTKGIVIPAPFDAKLRRVIS